MKKKWLVLGSAVGISSIVMVTTGFSAMASTSGYDAYKSALKNTKAVQNVAVQASASLQDNGNNLVSANGVFKVNVAGKTASGNANVTVNGTQQSLSVYKQEGQTVMKSASSDVYYVKQEGKEKNKKEKTTEDGQLSAQVETVIDALVGNLKDYVAVDNKSDGSKDISIQLDNAQIPTVINAIAPIAIKEATKHKDDREQKDDNKPEPQLFQKDLLKDAAPQLSQDIKIENVVIKATVDASNFIQHQEADLTVSGKDDSGTAHKVTLHLQADMSGYNSTTPDTIDLTGKTVQTLQKHGHEGKNHDDNE
ncbi:hypothetical protein [Paenibacillus sp. SI8]|uniref:hypothetical protein n=1 Tax=unclassified Paenibacillus TaxID=185978 RepID=UPI0034668356